MASLKSLFFFCNKLISLKILSFTGIKDKNRRHVERKEILKLCTRSSEEKCYRQNDEKIAALFCTDVSHLAPTMSFLMQTLTMLSSPDSKIIIPCVCYNNKDNKNLFLWHTFVRKSLNTLEKTLLLVFIRAL